MKSSEKQILAIFRNLTALILGSNSVKGLRVTKIDKQIKLGGVWGELESKKGFQRQSFTKCLRLTLVFNRNSALREKFNFCFSRVFASINKTFNYAGRLDYHSMKLRNCLDIFLFAKFVRQLVRQLVYTMLISNNGASFHL